MAACVEYGIHSCRNCLRCLLSTVQTCDKSPSLSCGAICQPSGIFTAKGSPTLGKNAMINSDVEVSVSGAAMRPRWKLSVNSESSSQRVRNLTYSRYDPFYLDPDRKL